MTDKQIIIDGTQCRYASFDGGNTQRLICEIDDCFCDCYRENECYYKQLKRKEQECEELKLLNNKLNSALGYRRAGKKTFIDLSAELDQLKTENEKQKEFRKLLEEQMEFNRNELELALSSEIKRSDFLLKEFQKVDKQRDNWREQAEKLKQTLAEIKDFLEYEFSGENIWVKETILQKISEVENDR